MEEARKKKPFSVMTPLALLGAFLSFSSAPIRAEICEDQFSQVAAAMDKQAFRSWLQGLAKQNSFSSHTLPVKVSALDGEDWQQLSALAMKHDLKGANGAFFVTDPDGVRIAVVKGARSDEEFGGGLLHIGWSQEKGGGAKREVFAYALDRLLKFGLVPYTTAGVDDSGRLVSMQKFMKGYQHLTPENLKSVKNADWQKKMLFDILIGNYDRHGGNFMIGKNGELALIDNASSLSKLKKVPNATQDASWLAPAASALGEVEAPLKEQILSLDPASLEALCVKFQIPAKARDLAMGRLRTLQARLRENRSMGEIVKELIPRQGGMQDVLFRELLLLAAPAAGAGYGGYEILIDRNR